MPTTRPRGRRPGPSTTRDAIAQAARELFAEQGYDRAAVRAIAARAGVDARLVSHHFGTKQQLFVQVTGLPIEPETLLGVLAGDPGTVGDRAARFVVALFADDRARQRLVGLLRAAASDPGAAASLRHAIGSRLVAPVAATVPAPDASLRLELAATQLLGLLMVRYVVQVEPLASADEATLRALLAPALQQHLGPLLRAAAAAP